MEKYFNFVTSNKRKYQEVSNLLPNTNQILKDLVEIQTNYIEEVVKYKLDQIKKIAAFPDDNTYYIVEDTSLYIDCLNGFPGPFIKYFNNSLTTNGIVNLVKKYEVNTAQAVTMIGLLDSNLNYHYFKGEVKGYISERKNNTLFGFEDIFYLEGNNISFSQMSTEDKNKVSMRGLAVNKLKKYYNL